MPGAATKSGKSITPPPSIKQLEKLMAKGGVQLRAGERDRLWQFHEMLREADSKLNLTRIRSFEAMVEKHYIDSMLAGYYLDLEGPIMDLGSGGGFPGIPLAIRHPDVQFKLVEGRRLRAGFLMNVQQKLGLKNVEVIARKLNPDDAIPVKTVITRAFFAIPGTLSRIDNCLEKDGTAIFMKGPNCDDEIAEANETFSGWELSDDISYLLPFSEAQRRLVVMRKMASTSRQKSTPLRQLSSRDNARIKSWAKLRTSKGIRKEHRAILTGDRYITELLQQSPELIEDTVTSDEQLRMTDQTWLVPGDIMRELDPISGEGPLAIVKTPALPPWDGQLDPERLTLFVAAQLPENVGAILRSAEAFGIQKVVLLEEAANPWLPRALRSGGPAALRLNLQRGPALTELSKSTVDTTSVVALDLQGMPLTDFASQQPSLPLGLVLGSEGPGLSRLPHDIQRITIPTSPVVDSLNVAVACGIALYALTGS